METMTVQEMRDAAVRVELGMPQTVAAKLVGINPATLSRYELDPLAVHDPAKRARCAKLYQELRRLLSGQWLKAA